MSKFPLRTKVIEVRGQKVTVRELTHAERKEFLEVFKTRDAYPYLMSKCAVEPTWTEEEVPQESSEIIIAICDAGLELSGLSKQKDQQEKQPDA